MIVCSDTTKDKAYIMVYYGTLKYIMGYYGIL